MNTSQVSYQQHLQQQAQQQGLQDASQLQQAQMGPNPSVINSQGMYPLQYQQLQKNQQQYYAQQQQQQQQQQQPQNLSNLPFQQHIQQRQQQQQPQHSQQQQFANSATTTPIATAAVAATSGNAALKLAEQQRLPLAPTPLEPALANSTFWQQQTQLAIASSKATQPHTYARTAAMASRIAQSNPSQQQSNIPLTVYQQAMQFVAQNIHAHKIAANIAASSSGAPGSTGSNSGANASSSGSGTNANSSNAVNCSPGTPGKSSASTVKNSAASAAVTAASAPAPGLHHMNQRKEQMEDERQRKINEDVKKQFWTALDLSGQGIPRISPKLFNYDFLQKLYLAHNKISYIPPSIKHLTQLKILDLSSNMLTSLPEELGLLYHLRYLFFFDNQIQHLPQQFGTLFQLDFMGIEGNPLDDETRTIMAKDGTRAVIHNLRDKTPRDVAPPPREWRVFEGNVVSVGQLPTAVTSTKTNNILDGFTESSEDPTNTNNIDTAISRSSNSAGSSQSSDTFTLLSYNILCDTYATPSMYSYTPSWAIEWPYRSELLIKELYHYNSDIICLQEVDKHSYDVFFSERLRERGYHTEYLQKGRVKINEGDEKKIDGCATFYRTDKFKLIERYNVEFSKVARDHDEFLKGRDTYNRFLNRDNVAMILVLEHLESGRLVVITNTHLHWDPAYKDVKVMQIVILLEELTKVVRRYTSNVTKEGKLHPKLTDLKMIPTVICGDFNSTADSGVCSLLINGQIKDHEDLVGRSYGRYSSEGTSHDFSFKSAYEPLKDELKFTNFTPNFVEVIDYIFYTDQSMTVKGALGPMDKEYSENNIAIPDVVHPSDHIPIMTEFQFKKIRDKVVSHPPVNFSSMSRKT